MRTCFISMAIAMSLVIVSCGQQDNYEESQLRECVLTVDSPDTKVGFDINNNFYWSKGDAIGVSTTQSGLNFVALTLEGTYGQSTATFKGLINGELSTYAVYPYYELKHKINGSQLTYYLPSSYTYTHVDQGVDSAVQGEGNSYNPMMWAKIENGGAQFKHLGGMFIVLIEGMPFESGSIKLMSDMRLTGKFTTDLSVDTPQISAVSNGDDYSEVTITFSGAEIGKPGEFYLPAPVGMYTEAIVKIYDADNNQVAMIPFANKEIKRTGMRVLRIKEGTITGGQMSIQGWTGGEDEGGAAE